MTTDTPKRLSDASIFEAKKFASAMREWASKQGAGSGLLLVEGAKTIDALLCHIAAFTAPHGIGIYEEGPKHTIPAGTDGACCEAMREKAAAHVLSLRELGGIGGYNTALEYAAKQIRALPLPVSADETTTRLERHYPSFGNVEICCCGLLMKGHPPREPLKSKQPSDTGAGK